MTPVESLDDWEFVSRILYKNGFERWQGQYDYYEPEGHHAFFRASGFPGVEVVTHSPEVQKAIFTYKNRVK